MYPVCTPARLTVRWSAQLSGGTPPSLSNDVDDDAAVHAVAVAGVATEERWRVILGACRGESVIASQSPPAVRRIPFDAAAHVARQKRLSVVDTERGSLEHRETANAPRNTRNEGRVCRRRDDEIRRVVKRVGALLIRRRSAERQVLRDADGPGDLAFDTEDPVDCVGDAGPERVVAEVRRSIGAGVKRGSAGDERDFDRARSWCHLLRGRTPSTDDDHRCDQNCERAFHGDLL